MIRVVKLVNNEQIDITDRFMQLVNKEGKSMYEFINIIRAEEKTNHIYVIDDRLKNQWRLY